LDFKGNIDFIYPGLPDTSKTPVSVDNTLLGEFESLN